MAVLLIAIAASAAVSAVRTALTSSPFYSGLFNPRIYFFHDCAQFFKNFREVRETFRIQRIKPTVNSLNGGSFLLVFYFCEAVFQFLLLCINARSCFFL